MTGKSNNVIEIFIVMKDGANLYYLLKVVRDGFDVYCRPPHLGIHYSLHESGKSHFRHEKNATKPRDELPVALVMGEAGKPIGNGIIRAPLGDLGRSSGICSVIFSIDSLSKDFRKFNKISKESFVIDKSLFSKDTKAVEVGVWAVPERNKVSFEFNNPNIPEYLLYKVVQCEPQIWIFARPF